VHRPRLLPGQVEIVQQPEHAVLAVDHPEALFDDPAQILRPPRTHPIARRIRTAQHQRLERRHLALVEPGRPAALGSVAQAVDALDVEADHPIPERLPIHAGLMRRLPACHAIQSVGKGEQSRCHPAVGLAPGQTPQLLGRNVVADRKGSGHSSIPRCITMQRKEAANCIIHNNSM
jgi:hypothetical protein